MLRVSLDDPCERLEHHRAFCGDDELDVAQVVHHHVALREDVITEERFARFKWAKHFLDNSLVDDTVGECTT